MTVIVPRRLLLDTNNLIKMSQDAFGDFIQRRRVDEFLSSLTIKGIYISLNWHIIEELFSSVNSQQAELRLKFIQKIELVCWIVSSKKGDISPSIVQSVIGSELIALIEQSNPDPAGVRESVETSIFHYGSGLEFSAIISESLPLLQSIFAQQQRKTREVESITKKISVPLERIRMTDLTTKTLRNARERHEFFVKLGASAKEDLSTHGDKRLKEDVNRIAANYIVSTQRAVSGFEGNNAGDLTDYFLKRDGFQRKDFADLVFLDEVLDRLTNLKQLRFIAKEYGLEWVKLKPIVLQNTVPTQLIINTLAQLDDSSRRVSGSDVNDRFLAALSIYHHCTTMDKRTHHKFGIACSKHKVISELSRPISKASNYFEVPLP